MKIKMNDFLLKKKNKKVCRRRSDGDAPATVLVGKVQGATTSVQWHHDPHERHSECRAGGQNKAHTGGRGALHVSRRESGRAPGTGTGARSICKLYRHGRPVSCPLRPDLCTCKLGIYLDCTLSYATSLILGTA